METAERLTVEAGGKITLPDAVLARYGLAEHTLMRVIQTRSGILLIPMTDEPMSKELAAELQEWQALGVESLAMFIYEDGEA